MNCGMLGDLSLPVKDQIDELARKKVWRYKANMDINQQYECYVGKQCIEVRRWTKGVNKDDPVVWVMFSDYSVGKVYQSDLEETE